jgi:dienelactone hydrolase
MIGSTLHWLMAALALISCASATPRGSLADGATGTIRFSTQSPTNAEFIRGHATAAAALISGELTLPRAPGGRVPAVVLVHGSGGVGNNMPGWRAELTGIGVATFIVDSFTGRGVSETATDQSRVSDGAMVVDAYRALELLATHPAIDPDRIAVMGFSKGGRVAVASSLLRFYTTWGPKTVRFAAHLPFYPPCLVHLIDEEKIAAPMRIFHGAADDWTPVAPCREYVERMRRAGGDVVLIEFPGAGHGFDVPTTRPGTYLRHVQNGSRCRFVEHFPGQFVSSSTGGTATGESCVTRGATVGYHAAAHRAAIAAVKEFLMATFKLQPR